MKRVLWLFTLLVFSGLLSAQDPGPVRGAKPVNPVEPEEEETGRFLYFIIGVNNYEVWENLDNAVPDALSLEKNLSENFGFQRAATTLTDREATRDNILRALDRLHGRLKPSDNLIIFFAGHGYTRIDTLGSTLHETGFIIPSDGRALPDKEWITYINVSHFLDRAALLPARHVTVILDACHAGIALGSNHTRYRGSESSMAAIKNSISRRVITSARHDQLAQDSGPVPDHSLFTGLLLEGLETGACDMNNDLRITTSEIGLYLESNVNAYSNGMQTPDFGAFAFDDRGEMVIELEENSPEMLINRAGAQLLRGELDPFLETAHLIEQRNIPLPSYHVIKYRASLLEHDPQTAIQVIEEILSLHRDDVGPRMVFELSRLLPKLRFWKNALGLPDPQEQTLLGKMEQEGDSRPIQITRTGIYDIRLAMRHPYIGELTNISNQKVFLYALYVDEYDVEVVRLGQAGSKGLEPGESVTTPLYRNLLDAAYIQLHLVISPEPLEVFATPPDHLSVQILPSWEPPEGLYSSILFLNFR